jgi:hypothetical protein
MPNPERADIHQFDQVLDSVWLSGVVSDLGIGGILIGVIDPDNIDAE